VELRIIAPPIIARNKEISLAEFLQVITSDQFTEKLSRFPRLSSERVSLDDAWHRNLA